MGTVRYGIVGTGPQAIGELDLVQSIMGLTDGSAATVAIATADALPLSLREGRKVRVEEITAVS